MKLLIDIGHPFHAHVFRPLIFKLKEEGWEIQVVARDKDVAQELLNEFGIPFISRGKGKKTFTGKVFYLLRAITIIWNVSRRFKPDFFMGFGSPYIGPVAKLSGRKSACIILDDTEIGGWERKVYTPFADCIINPSCYSLKHSAKQIFIDTYFELFYLHPNHQQPIANSQQPTANSKRPTTKSQNPHPLRCNWSSP